MYTLSSLEETLDTLILQQQMSNDIADENCYQLEKYALDKTQESLFARVCFLIETTLSKVIKRPTKQKKMIDHKIRLVFLEKGSPIPKHIRAFLHTSRKEMHIRPHRRKKSLVRVY